MEPTIRQEKTADRREVENLVRESFWNVYRPGALEHYVLHRLRDDPAFVREKEPDSFAAFDAQFPEKEKQRLPGQLFG